MHPTLDPWQLRNQFASLPQLETPRLILRKLTMRDAQDVFAYASDPEVARHVLWDVHTRVSDSRRYIRFVLREYRAGEPSSWGIVLKETGAVIGTCGYMACSVQDAAIEVGYSMGRAWWGRGLMTEALSAAVEYAFTELGMYRVYGRCELDNPASARVMEKCGFRHEGVMRGAVYNKGRFSDVAVSGILLADWEKGRQA